MGALSPAHLIIILVIALLVIGPGKLPETGAALGRAMREFRGAVDGKDEVATSVSDRAAPDTTFPTPAVPQANDRAVDAESGGLGSV
jgi:sec-independent protein translocase protein TatA